MQQFEIPAQKVEPGMIINGKSVNIDEEIKSKPFPQKDKLTCITYNVWFDSHKMYERNQELFKIFYQKSPDFICLQEVTGKFLQQICQHKELMENYYITLNNIRSYGVLILSKIPAVPYIVSYPSEMERYLLYIETKINNKNVYIATAHLESLAPYWKTRKAQLQKTFAHFNEFSNVLFMGDFNQDSPKEDCNISPEYDDVWLTLKDKNEQSNTMKETYQFSAWRPDRILCKKSKLIQPEHIERIGMDPIPFYVQNKPPNSDTVITPSDHFGLYAEFKINY